jgi:single-strand DNA-binding protein
MNIVGIMGKIISDPISRPVGKSTVVSFLLSVKGAGNWNKGDGATGYGSFSVEAWGNNATTIEKFCKKGTIISVSGSLKQDSWQDGNTTRERTKIVLNSFHFVNNDPEEFISEKDAEVLQVIDQFADFD